jgi:hypothetical protein
MREAGTQGMDRIAERAFEAFDGICLEALRSVIAELKSILKSGLETGKQNSSRDIILRLLLQNRFNQRHFIDSDSQRP